MFLEICISQKPQSVKLDDDLGEQVNQGDIL